MAAETPKDRLRIARMIEYRREVRQRFQKIVTEKQAIAQTIAQPFPMNTRLIHG
jgi:hypothetical protein